MSEIYSFEDAGHYKGIVQMDEISIELLILEAQRIKRIYELKKQRIYELKKQKAKEQK